MMKLTLDKDFRPCEVDDGDELFPNGVFVYNITKMLAHIARSSAEFKTVQIDVEELDNGFSDVDESYVQSVDVSVPVVLAEIAPGRYNLIDGHHRVAKALRQGMETIRAYKLTVLQHVQFLTSKDAYRKYVEYWNSKAAR